MPDLRAHSPSKIAAGFGGTLNLVISAAYIVVVVLLTALPIHLHLGPQPEITQSVFEEIIHFLGSPRGHYFWHYADARDWNHRYDLADDDWLESVPEIGILATVGRLMRRRLVRLIDESESCVPASNQTFARRS